MFTSLPAGLGLIKPASGLTLVQTKSVNGSYSGVSASWNASTTAGNFLIARVCGGRANAGGPPTITAPGSWTSAIDCTSAGPVNGLAFRGQIFYIANASSQSSTGTFTSQGYMMSGTLTMIFEEWSGIPTGTTLDKTAFTSNGTGTETTTCSSGTTATTTQANEIVFTGWFTGRANSAFSSPTNSFTLDNQYGSGGRGVATGHQVVSATGTYSSSTTMSISSNNAACIATFTL